MKSPEYLTHGTSSEKDAEKIKTEGFKAQEGRATVSADLIYSFEWATKQERRKGSKSETEIKEEEKGRIVIMKTPSEKSADYATHTSIEVDENKKEISGYSSKYESGRKQLAIYDEGDLVERRRKIERAKEELEKIREELSAFLRKNNINPEQIKSKEYLIEAIKSFDIEKKIEILKKTEEFEKQETEKIKEAELGTDISRENILMSIVPTPELGGKLEELREKIKNLEKIDLDNFTKEISKIIESDDENFLTSGLDIKEVVGSLLVSTIETEVVNMIRSLAMDVKRTRGYKIYNRGKNELKEKNIDRQSLKQKMEKIQFIVEGENFDTGMENLNRYIEINIKKMLEELE